MVGHVSVSAARTASIASSNRAPRPANGTSSAANSSSTCPAPTPMYDAAAREPVEVATVLAVVSGCRTATTATWVSNRTRDR